MEELSASFSEHFAPLEVTGVVHELTGTTLGRGSYATVQEVEWHGTQCAAKVLHEILLKDHSSGGAQRFVASFKKECLMWSKLSHPHIVQFLGVYFRRGSSIPILLMEKMDTSLRYHLEENLRDDLALADKVFILLQVVQGLAYLHSRKPALVHHDLSPNNILLSRVTLHAKLTDFGMSRVVDPLGASRKSSVKGTQAFMSPEALDEPPRYNDKLDVFSFGNVIITTLTHAWPNPGAPTKCKGKRIVALSEFERRERYVIQFRPEESTAFFAMVRSCLENRMNQRPTSLQLVGQMRQIEKEHPRKKLTEGPAVIEQLHAQLWRNATQLQENATQLEAKDTQLREKDTQVTQLLEENERLLLENSLLRRANQKPSSAENSLLRRANQKPSFAAENNFFRRANQKPTFAEKSFFQRANQKPLSVVKPASSISLAKPFKPEQNKVFRSDLIRPGELHSVKMPDLLIPTCHATPVTIGRDVYLVGGSTGEITTAQLVQVYNMDSGDCRTLPPSPQYWSAAVAIDDTLVLIGGRSSKTCKPTKLVSTWMAAEERWTQTLPPMKMKRSRPGALLLNNHLFVFGGSGKDEKTRRDCFEVLALNTKPQWRKGRGGIPGHLSSIQLGVFEDFVLLYGGISMVGSRTRACYTISVQALVDSATGTNPWSPPIHWTPVQDAPYIRSSLLTNSQDAMLIGGCSEDCQATRAIHHFSLSGLSKVTGQLSEPRSLPAVVAVSDRSFLVLGGDFSPRSKSFSYLLKSVELILY